MSQNKQKREAWCEATVTAAVQMFHRARLHPDNEAVPLETIARRCANTAFQDMADLLEGDKEVGAKRFAELADQRFAEAIYKIITQSEEKEELAA